jgi:hypothetical protein
MQVRWGRVVVLMGVLALVLVIGLCFLTTYLTRVVPVTVPGAGEVGNLRLPRETAAPAISAPTESRGQAGPTGASSGGAAGARVPPGELPPFKVLTLPYTPYMATLALMDARGYMEDLGYDLQLVDVYDPAVNLDETGQCEAVKSGQYQALATTVDATRKCGEGVGIAIPIGQSAGNDAIVVKPKMQTWNDVFEHAVAFTGYSVSEYMACFASHTANQPMKLPLRYDDAAKAVDAWMSSGAEQDIQSVVAWEPEVSRALAGVPGSRIILSSDQVRILWDVIEFPSALVSQDEKPFHAFARAYYQALLDLERDPAAALDAIVAWADDDEARKGLLTATDPDQFKKDLNNEAFATLRDAAILMDDPTTLRNRLDEAGFYWTYCGVPVPAVADVNQLIMPQFVLGARSDTTLLGRPDSRPGTKVFQATDFTNAAAVTDAQIEQARVLFQTGVNIEFLPNRTDFSDPEAASATLANAVRFLRTCQDCVLEVQGGAAYPGERVCPQCKPQDSDQLAVERGQRVYEELRMRFDVPEAQLRLVDKPHAPAHPGSNDATELSQDRRTFLTGYQLGGR